ncbi:PP2C family protein-serine/threonine phosphatase [Corynebacterium endometrii]|uniref:PP2C-family Ser/Thr phosphatase n=1 Tax=Corynebacterium endometrii TaxID=2488819 RepID=A0A4P7QDC4_9CORY|nr:protein phosphatase 2C domain-containing protein [Corynebacterium endometrii]QCB27353.1 PP2C-family Ser/Thr phosphatase [Corynebacterium endometrii]
MLKLNFTAASDRGLVRQNNEDSAFASPHVLVLADGMGGHAAGEVASQLMVTQLQKLNKDPEDNDMLALLGAAANDANDSIAGHVADHPETEGMGTTLTSLMFNGKQFGVCHVGDSRGYRLRDGKLEQITKDDTFVQSLVDEGRLDPEDVSSHPQKSLILKAYNGRDVEPSLYMLDARPGDKILLCSDGLSDPVTASTIESAMAYGTIQEITQRLIELALRSGGPDNVTIVMAEVVEDSASVSASLPTTPVLAGAIAGEVPEPTHPDSSASRAAALSRAALKGGVAAGAAGASTLRGHDGAAPQEGSAGAGPGAQAGKAKPQQIMPGGAQDTAELPREEAAAAAGAAGGSSSADGAAPGRGDSDARPGKGRGWLKGVVALMVLAVIALGALFGGKAYVDSRYFVAQAADTQALTIEQGVDVTVFGRALHSTYQNACINADGDLQLSPAACTGDYLPFKVTDLPEPERGALSGIGSGDYNAIQAELAKLSDKALPACRPEATRVDPDEQRSGRRSGNGAAEDSAKPTGEPTAAARETSVVIAQDGAEASETREPRETGSRSSGSAAPSSSATAERNSEYLSSPGIDCREVK